MWQQTERVLISFSFSAFVFGAVSSKPSQSPSFFREMIAPHSLTPNDVLQAFLPRNPILGMHGAALGFPPRYYVYYEYIDEDTQRYTVHTFVLCSACCRRCCCCCASHFNPFSCTRACTHTHTLVLSSLRQRTQALTHAQSHSCRHAFIFLSLCLSLSRFLTHPCTHTQACKHSFHSLVLILSLSLTPFSQMNFLQLLLYNFFSFSSYFCPTFYLKLKLTSSLLQELSISVLICFLCKLQLIFHLFSSSLSLVFFILY